MKKTKIIYLSTIVFGVLLLTSYQNCSKVHFSDVVGDLGGPENPIDPLACHVGSPTGISTYPSPCLGKPSFLNANSVGFQLSGAQLSKFSFVADDPVNGTPEDTYLYIEVATYAHPDSFKIYYDTISSESNPLFSVCHTSTWTQAWMGRFHTNRPYSTTIVQFGKFGNDPQYWIKLPKGTTKLHFDFGGIISASYLAVWGLNNFKNNLLAVQDQNVWEVHVSPEPMTAPLPGTSGCDPLTNGIGSYNCFSPGNFRYQAGPLVKYNDAVGGPHSDPNQMVCAD